MPQKNLREEEMRKAKMMSEGSPVLSTYFNRNITGKTEEEKQRLAAKTMIDEGGIGAEVYYSANQKIAKVDVDTDKSQLH